MSLRYLIQQPQLQLDAARLRPAAAVISTGGLVLFPTETVYGIGADLRSPRGLARLAEVKQRDGRQPWLVHCATVEQALEFTRKPDAAARRLAEKFWPGPLALVLPAASGLPREVTAGTGTVGIRVVSVPATRELVRELGSPLVGASANLRSKPATNSFHEIDRSIVRSCQVVLDAGTCGSGRASTVLDVTCDPPRLLRAGSVTLREIQSVL